MPQWRLRRAAPTDAPALARCVDVAYRHYIPRLGKPPGPMLADYAEEIARHQVWVAEAERQLIGGLVLVPAPDYLLLDNIAVHPEHQGRGVGRKILSCIHAVAGSKRTAAIRMATRVCSCANDWHSRTDTMPARQGMVSGTLCAWAAARMAPVGQRGPRLYPILADVRQGHASSLKWWQAVSPPTRARSLALHAVRSRSCNGSGSNTGKG
jgi:N-acetylglutamate synthase-like GNAT family acetyltransferase